jgi:hypothetical protein
MACLLSYGTESSVVLSNIKTVRIKIHKTAVILVLYEYKVCVHISLPHCKTYLNIGYEKIFRKCVQVQIYGDGGVTSKLH